MGSQEGSSRGKATKPKHPPRRPRRSPNRRHISDRDLGTLADYDHDLSLPGGFDFRDRKGGEVVVVRRSDRKQFLSLDEGTVLAWAEVYSRRDGSVGYKTTEVFRRCWAGASPGQAGGPFEFPLDRNSITYPDITSFADLRRHYPLMAVFEYQRTAEGYPVVVRLVDGTQFAFLIEEEMLSFDQPYTRKDGSTGFRTTEVFKQS